MDGHVQIRDGFSGDLPKLFPLGYTPAESPGSVLAPLPEYESLRPAQRIRDLQQDYVLYTPALMYMTVPWPVDPWMSFCQTIGEEYRPRLLVADRPLLGNVPSMWARHIQLLPRPIGELAIQFFGTLAVHDPGKDVLYRVRSQEICISEPYLLDASQYVPVTAAVVESTAGSHFFVQKQEQGVIQPWYRFDENMVFEDTVKFSMALRAANNPYGGDVYES
jgi:hypothetical protein